MRVIQKFALPLTAVLVAVFAWGLSQSAQQRLPQAAAETASPWDSLTAAEYETAAAAVTQAADGNVLFVRISLKQPDKQTALAWQPGTKAVRHAEVAYLQNGRSFLADVDLADGRVSAPVRPGGGMIMYSGSGELNPMVMQLSEDPQVLEALAARGIAKGEALCLPRTIGRFFADQADPRRDRLVRLDCFYIAGSGGLGILPSTNLFARPIEGLGILYNVSTDEIIDITDTAAGNPPPHDVSPDEYHAGAMRHRARLKPIVVSRPEGVNFAVSGSRVDWQGWQFRLRFDARQGTILNRVGHVGPDGFRSVAYEIAMSEMFVPYHENDPNWFYRAYFDMGEYGFGNMATPLRDADCPASALYQSVTLHAADGMPFEADRRICIFEHDPGHPAWRHHETVYDGVPGLANHHTRRATELVVRMVATIGNYDYFQDYVFTQDGRLRIRLISTGVDAVKGVLSKTLTDPTAAADTATGTLVAPHRLAVNHDHFFNYRIDMDVDGPANNFDRLRLRPVPVTADAPRQGLWAISPQRVRDERQARTKMSAERPALLVFSSDARTNAMGYPSAYQLMMPNVKPLVSREDETFKRAYFVQNNLWVTRFKRDELFASGLQINQSIPYLGLPEYAADNENLEGADLVAWPTIGFHHVPMAEDWPVMPSKVDEIILKPRNFFDRNPAINLRD